MREGNEHWVGLTAEERGEFHRIADTFDLGWHTAGPAEPAAPHLRLASLLPPGGLLRRAVLVELARIDLEYRLDRFGAGRVEDYLRAFPELAADFPAVLVLLRSEIEARSRRAAVPFEECRHRFPHCADHIRDLWPTGPDIPEKTSGPVLPSPNGPPGYEILGELGRGGMGVVYKARQVKADRVVALKMMLKAEHAGEDERARFRAEVEAVGRLQHPHIVQLFETGEMGGHPYFSLEYCPGGGLDRWLDGKPLTAREGARLVETLARAVQAAHERGVIHRDLKPANILLAREGPGPAADRPPVDFVPKITDFGLARRLDTSQHTPSGAILGTPSYMAPEQAGGQKDIGPGADVYALGAILYECLTGRPPFKAATALETAFQVISDEPVPPRRLNPAVPPDLEAVVLKCLEKSPASRISTAEELAEELRRYLDGRPVRTRPVGAWEQGRRWCRRNPGLAVAIAGFVVVLLLGIAVSTGFAVYASGQKATADQRSEALQAQVVETRTEWERAEGEKSEKARQLKLSRNAFMTAQLLRVAALYEREPMAARELLHDCQACPLDLRDAAWHFYDHACRRWQQDAFSTSGLGPAQTGALSPSGHIRYGMVALVTPDRKAVIIAVGDPELHLWDLATGRKRRAFHGRTADVLSLGTSPDGRILAGGLADGTIHLWDLRTGEPKRVLRGHPGGVLSLALTRRGYLVSLSRVWDEQQKSYRGGEVRLWDVETGQMKGVMRPSQGDPLGIGVSPDGKTLAVGVGIREAGDKGYTGGAVSLFDLELKKEPRVLGTFQAGVWEVHFSPQDASTLACAAGKEVSLWSPDTGTRRAVLAAHTDLVTVIAFSPDGRRLASGGDDRTVRLWDVETGQERAVLPYHYGRVGHLTFRADSRTLVVLGPSDEVFVWDVGGSQDVATLADHQAQVFAVAASPDGKTLASGGRDGTIRLRDAATGAVRRVLEGPGCPVVCLAFSPDGRTLASGWGNTTAVLLWEPATGRLEKVLKGHGLWVSAVAFSPDGGTLASGSWDGDVRLWDAASGVPQAVLHEKTQVSSVAFSADGRTLFAGEMFHQVRVWDVESRKVRMVLEGHPADVAALAVSPDGKTLASSTWGLMPTFKGTLPEVRLWDLDTGRLRAVLHGHADGVTCLAFSPDGQTLASGSKDTTIRLWDMLRNQTRAVLKGHTREVKSVVFTPDGERLASGSADRTVRLWDVGGGEEQVIFTRESGYGQVCALDRAGTTLATTSTGQTVLRDLATGEERAVLAINTGPASCHALSLESQIMATGVGVEDEQKNETTGMVRVWDLRTRELRATLKGHRGKVQCVALSPDGATLVSASGVWDVKEEGYTAGEIRVWDPFTGEQKAMLEGHKGEIDLLAFSGDGRTLASRSEDKTVRVWDTETGRAQVLTEDATGSFTALALSPDGKLAGTGGEKGPVTLWDVASGRPVVTLKGHAKQVDGLAFRPDGRVLASSSRDRTVRLWDIGAGTELRVLDGKERAFSHLAFTPDGNVLVGHSKSAGTVLAGYPEQEVHLWHLGKEGRTAGKR